MCIYIFLIALIASMEEAVWTITSFDKFIRTDGHSSKERLDSTSVWLDSFSKL